MIIQQLNRKNFLVNLLKSFRNIKNSITFDKNYIDEKDTHFNHYRVYTF